VDREENEIGEKGKLFASSTLRLNGINAWPIVKNKPNLTKYRTEVK